MQEKLSTTALANQREMEPKALFAELSHFGYIVRHESKWLLTDIGKKFGGEYVEHSQYGAFIVWPNNLLIDQELSQGKRLTATQIGELIHLNAKKVNQLLNELGWIDKQEDGWHITDAGLRAGGEQRTDKQSSTLFTVWHDTLFKNQHFRHSVKEFLGAESDSHATDKSFASFQQRFAAKHRTSDGHYVRSKGELLIDNWLYMAGLVHAYERRLPVEEAILSSFYLPRGKVYIQYWGTDDGATPEQERQEKWAIYLKYGFNLIEIDVNDVKQLDQILPNALRQFGIVAY